jgi:hypothetical protein
MPSPDAGNRTRDVRMVVLVNKYATPLAVILVGLGLVFSQPIGAVKTLSAGLLVFGMIFNMLAMPVISRFGGENPWIPKARMLINILVNVVMVYFLGAYWPSIWMLLALTPIATAIYADRSTTFITAAGISAALAVIQLLHSTSSSPSDWGELIGRVAFILLLSLLINELVGAARAKEGN